MAMLNISAEELCNLAKQLKSCSNALIQDISTADKLLSTINVAWSGAELQSLTTEAHRSTSDCLQLSDVLATLAEYLESASVSYQQAEQNLIQRIENII